MPNEKLCVVRIPHPRNEHGIDDKALSLKCWNTKKYHRRKFLRTHGAYVNRDGKKKNGEILFWGEWEPQSRVEKIRRARAKSDQVKDGPRFIHEPFWEKYDECTSLQNTDPFVFGSNFRYARCQQRGQLKCLDKGSVILFGSSIKRAPLRYDFVLDTVLVVKDHRKYGNRSEFEEALKEMEKENSEKERETYECVTMQPIFFGKGKVPVCAKTNSGSQKLYEGAIFEEPGRIYDMFSFFPCIPYRQHSKGFARPVIKLEFSDNQTRKYQIKCYNKIEDIRKLWKNVKNQVLRNNLMLGISADLPKQNNKQRTLK